MPDSPLKNGLKALTLGIENDAKAWHVALEKWYDDTMDRLDGLYKRHTQIILLYLGLALAVVCNVNLLRVGRALWTSEPTRAQLSSLAEYYKCKEARQLHGRKFVNIRMVGQKPTGGKPLKSDSPPGPYLATRNCTSEFQPLTGERLPCRAATLPKMTA